MQQYSAVLQVPGNFHVATHSAKERPVDGGNMQHTIEYIAFGDDVPTVSSPATLPPHYLPEYCQKALKYI